MFFLQGIDKVELVPSLFEENLNPKDFPDYPENASKLLSG
jgi:hypothetical protein